jgi:hypothetical protein
MNRGGNAIDGEYSTVEVRMNMYSMPHPNSVASIMNACSFFGVLAHLSVRYMSDPRLIQAMYCQ